MSRAGFLCGERDSVTCTSTVLQLRSKTVVLRDPAASVRTNDFCPASPEASFESLSLALANEKKHLRVSFLARGGRGIRTLEGVAPFLVFKTSAFNQLSHPSVQYKLCVAL